jgi:lipoprotein NlpI
MRLPIPAAIVIVGFLIANFGACSLVAGKPRAADPQMDSVLQAYRAGDLDKALRELEPLLDAQAAYEEPDKRTHQLAAQILHARGEDHFRHSRIAESIADFDRELLFRPDRGPEHWQRGIALYYAGEYEKGAKQFELHQKVNPQDVENAAWHFLCVVRSPGGSFESARESLIRVTDDRRIPMAQMQQLFAGAAKPEEVLQAGASAGGAAKFYAELYVGLYYEAIGRSDESLALIEAAAKNSAAKDSYMGDVARVHVALRTKAQQVDTSSVKNANGEKPRKVLFLAGNPSHGYGAHDHWAGCKLLAKSLDDSGLPIETEVYRYGWPKDPKTFDGVDCVVIYADGGGGHPANEHLAEMDALAKKGIGIVCLHYAVEVPKDKWETSSWNGSEDTLKWTGRLTRTGRPTSQNCPNIRSRLA